MQSQMQAPQGKLSRRLLPACVPALLAVVLRLLLARIPAVLLTGVALLLLAGVAAGLWLTMLRLTWLRLTVLRLLGLLAGVAAPLLRLLTGLRREGLVVGLVLRLALGRQQPIDLRVRGPAPYPDDEDDDAQQRERSVEQAVREGEPGARIRKSLTTSNACRIGASRKTRPNKVMNAPAPVITPAPIAGAAISNPSTRAMASNSPSHGRVRLRSEFSTTARDVASRVMAYDAPTIVAYPRTTPMTSPRPGTGLAGMPKTLDG